MTGEQRRDCDGSVDPITIPKRERSKGTFHSWSGYCTSFLYKDSLLHAHLIICYKIIKKFGQILFQYSRQSVSLYIIIHKIIFLVLLIFSNMYRYTVLFEFHRFYNVFFTWKSNFISERLMEKTNYAIW